MTISARIHFFNDKGQMKEISMAKYNRLVRYEGCEGFESYAGQRVRCAVSCVELEDRKAVNITSINYSIIPFDGSGQIDQKEYDRGIKLAMSGFDTFSKLISPSKNDDVLDLAPKISRETHKNEFEWTPTQKEIDLIVSDVFSSNK